MPRAPPKSYSLLLKTHKLVILLSAPATDTVADLKAHALSALQSRVLTKYERTQRDADPMMEDEDEDERILRHIPEVQTADDFELCKGVPEKASGRGNHFGQVAVVPRKFERLEAGQQIKASLTNWEVVYIQFKDPRSGSLLPVTVTLAQQEDDGLESRERVYQAAPEPASTSSKADASTSKRKRKATED